MSPDEPEPDPYRAAVGELIEVGLGFNAVLDALRKTLVAAAQPLPEAVETVERLVAAYDRNASAVRRNLLLAHHFARTPRDLLPAPDPAADRAAQRRLILRKVQNELTGRPGAEALGSELLDRLDSPEFEQELVTTPASVIIADLATDLGLRYSGAYRRTPDDIAALHEIAARAPAPTPAPASTPPRIPEPGQPPSSVLLADPERLHHRRAPDRVG